MSASQPPFPAPYKASGTVGVWDSPALWPSVHPFVPMTKQQGRFEDMLSSVPGLLGVLGQCSLLTRVGVVRALGEPGLWATTDHPHPTPRSPEGPARGGSSICEEPRWPGSPPTLIHSRSASKAGPGSAPRGHRASWHTIFLREVLGCPHQKRPHILFACFSDTPSTWLLQVTSTADICLQSCTLSSPIKVTRCHVGTESVPGSVLALGSRSA